MTVGQIKTLNRAMNSKVSTAAKVARTQTRTGRTLANTGQKALRPNVSMGARLGDAMGAGYREAFKGAKTGGVSGAVNAFKKAHINADGSLNKARVAGTIVTTNVASRVITGGGLYKDRNGNTNLPIPFL